MSDGQNRKDIRPGIEVLIVLKQDQRTGKLTRGIVKDILTKSLGSSNHINVAKTTILALSQLRNPKEALAKRKETLKAEEAATSV